MEHLMLSDQLTAQIRGILTAIGTLLATLGVATPGVIDAKINTAMLIVGPLLMIGSSLWSVYSNLKSVQIASVAAMPEVKGVVTTSTIAGRDMANSIPGPAVAAAGTDNAKAIAATGATS